MRTNRSDSCCWCGTVVSRVDTAGVGPDNRTDNVIGAGPATGTAVTVGAGAGTGAGAVSDAGMSSADTAS